MDFAFREEQELVRDLARQILEREVTPERLKAVEAGADGFDAELWRKLADANLLGIAVPEAQGGMGLGLLELCVLLEEVGRAVAPVPAGAALVLGALPILEAGSAAQRERWLTPLARGEAILSAALVDASSDDPARPGTRARRDGDGWSLDGVKRLVPAAHLATRVLVPAASDDGVAIFLVDPGAAGVGTERRRISTGEVLADLTLEGAHGERLGQGPGAALAARLFDLGQVALCATQLGVSERALEITAGHLREREQFGVPLGTFQAVQHRSADAWIDLAAMRWTTWRAAWSLAEGREATRETTVAKFWAAEGGASIADSTQHLHGGLGVDMDYPIHRFFLWSKALELSLGGATPQLARLGRELARPGALEAA